MVESIGRGSIIAWIIVNAGLLSPAWAGQEGAAGQRRLVEQCPLVKAKLDLAFSRNPDFASIGDEANKRIAECQYLKELGDAVADGYSAFQSCRGVSVTGLGAGKAEVRSILSRIRQATSRTCDD